MLLKDMRLFIFDYFIQIEDLEIVLNDKIKETIEIKASIPYSAK